MGVLLYMMYKHYVYNSNCCIAISLLYLDYTGMQALSNFRHSLLTKEVHFIANLLQRGICYEVSGLFCIAFFPRYHSLFYYKKQVKIIFLFLWLSLPLYKIREVSLRILIKLKLTLLPELKRNYLPSNYLTDNQHWFKTRKG